jgi:hypothetical protein
VGPQCFPKAPGLGKEVWDPSLPAPVGQGQDSHCVGTEHSSQLRQTGRELGSEWQDGPEIHSIPKSPQAAHPPQGAAFAHYHRITRSVEGSQQAEVGWVKGSLRRGR